MRVGVVGAGASGLFVAGCLAKQGHNVVVFDKNEKVGKKLFITGKGRCNLTNLCEPNEFLQNVVRGDKFLRTAIYNFSSFDAVDYFESMGLRTKVERGNRVFPESDKSSDVIKALQKHCQDVSFELNCVVESIKKSGDVFVVTSSQGKFDFDKIVVATGGKSYKGTGSDGAGYAFAKTFGHQIVPIVPALCPIKIKNKFVTSLQGVSLKNVQLNVVADGKKLGFFGEMMFTDCGITGPIVLSASSYVNRAEKVALTLDFKPALSEQQLDARLLRDFDENKNKDLKNVLKGLLPKAVADVFADVCGIDENKKNNSITREERNKIVETLKKFPLEFSGLYDIDAGIVTSGGVALNEVNPKTFESKKQDGLYFVGEVLDIDALTGGYNLQIAWATAYSCAKNMNDLEKF